MRLQYSSKRQLTSIFGGVGFLLILASQPLWAADPVCQCLPSEGSDQTLLRGDSSSQSPFDLLFDVKVAAKGVYQGSLCTPNAPLVTEVKLWMPAMGHGSSPTALEPFDGNCLRVKKVNFMMPGLWEVRVSYQDGSVGQSTIEVP